MVYKKNENIIVFLRKNRNRIAMKPEQIIRSDFFNCEEVDEQVQEKLKLYINAVRCFERNTHKCAYILNCQTMRVEFISANALAWCGVTEQQIMSNGIDFFIKHVPECEQKRILEVSYSALRKVRELSTNSYDNFTLSYNLHIFVEGKSRLVSHHFSPLFSSSNGRVLFALCTIGLAPNPQSNYFVLKAGTQLFRYDFTQKEWFEDHKINLSQVEMDILILIAQGLSTESIADLMCRAVDTIKSAKKKIFKKLGVKNSVEALAYVINYRLLE